MDDFKANTTTGHILGQLRLTYPLKPTKDQLAEAKKALRASMLANAWSLNAETAQSRNSAGKGSGTGSGSGSGIGFDIKSPPFPHLIGAKKVSEKFRVRHGLTKTPTYHAALYHLGAIEKLISDESKVSTLKIAIAIAERDKGIGAGALSTKREAKFDYELTQFAHSATAWAFIGPKDAKVRQLYIAEIKEISGKIKARIKSGKLTLIQAEKQAHILRNIAIDEMRDISTTIGEAIADEIKQRGRSLDILRQNKIDGLLKQGTKFSSQVYDELVEAEKNVIREAIVDSVGKSNKRVDALVKVSGYLGKLVIPVSIGVSAYAVYEAENKLLEIGRQASGFLGGMAGGAGGAYAGASAGVACGAAAFICMPAFAFVGMIIGGLGGSYATTEVYEYVFDYDPDEFIQVFMETSVENDR